MTCLIQYKILREINTDPQRRCYNGCHAKSELIWSNWQDLESEIKSEDVENRLTFWKELNDYAVSQRGETDTKKQFRVIQGDPT
jgi:hypothetical protein